MLKILKRSTAVGAMVLCVPFLADSNANPAISTPDALSRELLASADNGNANTIISPLSLAAVVALSRAGLGDAPLALEMPESVSMTYALWLDTGMVPTEQAAEVLEHGWHAKVEELDLANGGKETINAWAKEATNGIIETLIQDPLTDATLVLTNALHFKDAWLSQFDPGQTAPMPFTLADGSKIDVAFMTGNKTFPCWEIDGQYVIAMPFASGGHLLISMPVVAADTAQPDPATEGAATDGETAEASVPADPEPDEAAPQDEVAAEEQPVESPAPAQTHPYALEDAQLVRLALPKLDLSAELDLSQLLQEASLQEDFLEGLATLTEAPALPGPVMQSVVFNADEFGAEAAAATAAVGVRSIQTTTAPLVVFDRPFDLFLMMPGTGTALIAASVRDPS